MQTKSCRFFNQGNCKKGDQCLYKHDVKSRKMRNTESFTPSSRTPDLRLVYGSGKNIFYPREHTTRDLILVPDLFCEPDDFTLYHQLLKELKDTKIDVWKPWHGDSHQIADDHMQWKESCPTFSTIVEKIKNYFGMEVKATRFNWYRDFSEWKPFHHDAAAIKKNKAATQNFTVAVSFGAERECAFQHSSVHTKKTPRDATVISVPLPNGTIYAFNKDVNIQWKHGILQKSSEYEIVDEGQITNPIVDAAPIVDADPIVDEGRISIILWGWVEQH